MENVTKKMVSNGLYSAEVICRGLKNVSLEEKINADKGNGEKMESGVQYPSRPYEPDCVTFIRRGFCRYGSACRFNHPINRMVKIKNYTSLCQVAEDIPVRMAKKKCKYYLSIGGCRNGNSCKFAHYMEKTDMRQMASCPTGTPFQPDLAARISSPSRQNVEHIHAPTMAMGDDTINQKVNTEEHPSRGVDFNQPNGDPIETGGVNASPTGLLLKHDSMEYSSSPTGRIRAPSPTMAEEDDDVGEETDHEDGYYEERSERRIAKMLSVPVGPTGLPLRPERSVCVYYSQYGLCIYGISCPDDHSLDRVLA